MKALWLEGGELRLRADLAVPDAAPGEALVAVLSAGICGTDVALSMYGFRGVPGHEFVGRVEAGPEPLRGQRVVGEINVACGKCRHCRGGEKKHCVRRQALGIRGRHGAFAQYLTLPAENLHPVPNCVPDDCAVFTEPLAAALDVVEQVPVSGADRVLVVGDGKLAQLVCRVLAVRGARVDVVGRHRRKLERLEGVAAARFSDPAAVSKNYDVAVECTGNAGGVATALGALRPRGTLVLKSTSAETCALDATRVVVDELRLVGSRCGPFDKALDLLATGSIDPRGLIDGRYPLDRGVEGFSRSRERGVLKILLDVPI